MSQRVPPGDPEDAKVGRILILGAGAGGLRTALGLDRLLIGRREHEVLLVDQHDHHQVQPRLPEAAAGLVSPDSLLLPIRRVLNGRRVGFLRATVQSLDLANHAVTTSAGPLDYRWLVVALGATASVRNLPGQVDAALVLKTVADAVRVHDATGEAFRQAAWKLDAAERAALATVVVVGGGYTGVELAAGLADRALDLAARYRLPDGVGRAVLVERAERLLPEYGRDLSEVVQTVLKRKGVQVRLRTPVTEVKSGSATLATGEVIRCGTIVWAGGVEPSPVLRSSGLPLDPAGRVVVDRRLSVVEHPGVYGLGDAAAMVGGELGAPASAQLAVRQGEVVAHNVFAEIAGLPFRELRSEPSDVVVSLGRGEAAAVVRGFVLTGWRAIAAKRVAELRYLAEIGGPAGLVAGVTR